MILKIDFLLFSSLKTIESTESAINCGFPEDNKKSLVKAILLSLFKAQFF
jgi:hypothetical protein